MILFSLSQVKPRMLVHGHGAMPLGFKFPSYLPIPRSTRIRYSSGVNLRPYQESCIRSCLDALENGCSRIGVSLPTGSGKTTVFLSLLSRLPPLNIRATRSLIIVNSIQLARQTAEQARKLIPHLAVEIEQGIRYQATGLADL
jgi:ATP-dependent helicase IRC3